MGQTLSLPSYIVLLTTHDRALEPDQIPEGSEVAHTVEELLAVHDIDRLMTDFLSGLLGHVHFVLTVPAVWSEKSSQRTAEALRRTHCFPKGAKILVMSEPEAAAIHTLHSTDRHHLNVGDSFVVVDAGGGTVDLITYTVKSLDPLLEVMEAGPGSGDICGSQMLDSRFQQYLDEKLGGADGYTHDAQLEAMEHFASNVCLTWQALSDVLSPLTLTGIRLNELFLRGAEQRITQSQSQACKETGI